ncbi:hypothetical protein PFNF54_02628 [Plasmodium falciparum NF54]|uniref:PUB domain-containing protein n=1 Tax=Plasmodium falciparum (isolate NF54) TaxID=5843 RepID=W7KFQ9_PLAFO|nr:hypothetical protein PFNF54_02628 [Plasmodium falciparum NF54]
MSCLSIDCCVNPFTIDVIRKYNEVFNFMLEDVCLNIEKNIMKDKERICRDFKMLSNMKCKGEKPFLLCINKNVLKKNILLEEEKKLEKLKKEYEEKNETSKDVDNVLKKSKIQTEIKTYNQEEINKSNIQILDDNNNNMKEDVMENYKKDGRKNKFFIYHQGSINMSSFFKTKEYKNTPISLNLPDKLKVVIYTDNYVNKNDINITIQRKRKILEIKFNNKEKDLTINLPYPCDEKDYSCVLHIEKKKIEIYLKLHDEYVKRYAQEIYDKYISEEKDAFGYIDEVVEQYEQEEKNKNKNKNKNNGDENIEDAISWIELLDETENMTDEELKDVNTKDEEKGDSFKNKEKLKSENDMDENNITSCEKMSKLSPEEAQKKALELQKKIREKKLLKEKEEELEKEKKRIAMTKEMQKRKEQLEEYERKKYIESLEREKNEHKKEKEKQLELLKREYEAKFGIEYKIGNEKKKLQDLTENEKRDEIAILFNNLKKNYKDTKKQELLASLNILRTYFSNIYDNILEKKYQKIKKENKIFVEKIKIFEEMLHIFLLVGFEDTGKMGKFLN